MSMKVLKNNKEKDRSYEAHIHCDLLTTSSIKQNHFE